MIESSLFQPSLTNELFQDWSFKDDIGSDAYLFDCDKDDFLSNYDSISSNSSDIDAYNLEDFEEPSVLTDEFVSQIIGNDLFSSLSQLDNFNQPSSYSNNLNLSKSNVTLSKRKKTTSSPQSTKSQQSSWSNMSADEKYKTLLEISERTRTMALDDQIKIIQIMSPNYNLSSNMKEFPLDSSLLNDAKLKKIQEYFKRHKKPVKSKKSCKSKISKKPRQRKEKKFSEKEECRKLKMKQKRQGRKEEKSGLFVYEKVVKFSNLEEDEEVNILE